MMQAQIEIRGLDRVRRKLERMKQSIRPQMEKATREAIHYVHSQVPAYPPPPPTSTYRRTGTLGRSVTVFQHHAPGALSRVEPLGDEVRGVIGTAIEYAPDVIDERHQARMHKGRWYTLQRVVRQATVGIKRIYEKMVRELWR